MAPGTGDNDDAANRNPTRNAVIIIIYYATSEVPQPPVNGNIIISVCLNYSLYRNKRASTFEAYTPRSCCLDR